MEAAEKPENAKAIVSVLLSKIKARPELKPKKASAIRCGLKKKLLDLVVIVSWSKLFDLVLSRIIYNSYNNHIFFICLLGLT
ncbi:MAG: hypothetical protein ABSA84_02810 [Gammaproteobacteria bacterium]